MLSLSVGGCLSATRRTWHLSHESFKQITCQWLYILRAIVRNIIPTTTTTNARHVEKNTFDISSITSLFYCSENIRVGRAKEIKNFLSSVRERSPWQIHDEAFNRETDFNSAELHKRLLLFHHQLYGIDELSEILLGYNIIFLFFVILYVLSYYCIGLL